MSSLLSRLKTQILGIVNDAQEASEDLGSIARQTVREIDENIADLEEAIVGIRAEQVILTNKISKEEENITKYAGYAQKAVLASNDALALEAIADKNAAIKRRDDLQAQADKFEPAVRQVNEKLAELRKRKDQMAREASLIEGRANIAEAQDRVATVLGGIGTGESASAKFDQLTERLEKDEARAQAKMEMASEKDGSSQANKYAALEQADTSAQDELAALKAAAGK